MKRTFLVIRFSALGDVALSVPVLKHVTAHNPNAHFIVVSDIKWGDLFDGIDRVGFQGFDLKKKHSGILGIFSIYWFLLRNYQFEAVVDLHSVIRTHILRALFILSGKQVASVDKGRSEKAIITREKNKKLYQLLHTTERYLKVFEHFGLTVNRQLLTDDLIKVKKNISTTKKLGFAPFARHALKMYPIESMEQVIRYFDKEGFELYFFGKGSSERNLINEWGKKFQHAISMNDTLSLSEELAIISTLDLMVTMDSANMHLASNVEVPVVSIWGPTHPFIGFYGFRQDPSNAVQVDLSCRPCSVYGNKQCWRGDHACIQEIKPVDIISKIENLLH